METGNAIELKGVTKRFGDVIANDNVNLTVRKGEILSILGENGSGKTTLMNMLSGMYFPDEGEVYVDGKEVTIRSPKDSFALGIGMIHQHFKLMNHSNSEFEGIFRGPDRHGFPIHTDFPLIREINTGEHVHQRSLSTTILS